MSTFSTASVEGRARAPPCPRRDRGSPPPRRPGRCRARASDSACSGCSAPGQDAAVDGRVQRLDAAVEDLREARHLGDAAHGHAGLAQLLARCRRWRRSRSRARPGRAPGPRCRPCGRRRGSRSSRSCRPPVVCSESRAVRARALLRRRRRRRGAGPCGSRARRWPGAGMRVTSPRTVAPHREPGGGDRRDRARVGQRGHAEDRRAVVDRAVVDHAPVAEQLRPDHAGVAAAAAEQAAASRPAGCRAGRRSAAASSSTTGILCRLASTNA